MSNFYHLLLQQLTTSPFQLAQRSKRPVRNGCALTNRPKWTVKQPHINRMYVKTLSKTSSMPGVKPASF